MEPKSYTEPKRLENVVFSPIRQISDRARALKEGGKDVIFLSAGEPNFNTPQPIKDAVIEAINANRTHYCSNRGELVLREQIAKKIYEDTGVSYDPVNEILVTIGGAEAINHAFLATIDQGDEVILITPAFINYECMIHMCGGVVVEVPLRAENQFQLDIHELESKITTKTKMIVINNPCNPTGTVYSYEILKRLSELAVEHDLLVFSDEIYNKLVYDDVKFYSVASFPGMKERTLMMNGFSKTYAMTGWRLGYLAFDERLLGRFLRVHQYATTSGVTFVQEGVAKTMNLPATNQEVEAMIIEFANRRVRIMELLDEIEGIHYVKPDGAFYIMVDVSKTGLSGQEFSDKLLNEYYVATVPAIGLGRECKDFIRMSYAASMSDIERGLARMKECAKEVMA